MGVGVILTGMVSRRMFETSIVTLEPATGLREAPPVRVEPAPLGLQVRLWFEVIEASDRICMIDGAEMMTWDLFARWRL